MEARNIAQRYAIVFCDKLGDNATTTHGKFQQAFGDHAMSRAKAFCWHFTERRTLVEDDQSSRRPSTTRMGDDKELVRDHVR
jgi:epoxyqueuosine reductase QueG